MDFNVKEIYTLYFTYVKVYIYNIVNLVNRYRTMSKLPRITQALRIFTTLERRGNMVDPEPNDLLRKRQEQKKLER